MSGFFRTCLGLLNECAGEVKEAAVSCFINIKESCSGENDTNNNLENENETIKNNNNEIEENKEDVLLSEISSKFNKIYYNYDTGREESRNFLIQNNEFLNKTADDLIKKYEKIKSNNYKEIEKLSKEVDDFCKKVKEERKKPDNISHNKDNVSEKLIYTFSLKEHFCEKEEKKD